MNDAQLLGLVKKLPKQVISLLLSNELIKLKDPKGSYIFSNCEVLPNANLEPIYTEDQIKKLRECFPPNYKGVYEHFVSKLESFSLQNPNYTFNQIYEAFQYWNKTQIPPYCGKADNFINLEKDKIKGSRLLETLQMLYSGQDAHIEVKVYQ